MVVELGAPPADNSTHEQPNTALDESVVLQDVPWDLYERLLKLRGESSVPRMTYLDGALELMSPSRNHDLIKTCLARLVEAWAEERGIAITGLGSWTLRQKKKKRGLEPDECYLIGEPFDDEDRVPDLALEVAFPRWKISKLDVYQGLGVREVWVWRSRRIHLYSLSENGYTEIEKSAALAGIDTVLLARLCEQLNQSAAVRDLREALRR